MVWPAARHDEHGVDADVVAVAHEPLRQALGGDRHTPQPVTVERESSLVSGGPCLDLDKCDRPAPTGDDVDLAAADAHPPPKDPPAVEPQKPACEGLRTASALLGL